MPPAQSSDPAPVLDEPAPVLDDPAAPPRAAEPPPTPGLNVPRGQLDQDLVGSVAWSAAAKWGAQIASWASTIVVARLLATTDYGIIGMSSLFMGLVALVSEMGIGSSIVMLRNLDDEATAQLNGLAFGVGVIAFVLTLGAAPLMGIFFRSPDLPAVVAVMGLTFIIAGMRSVPTALIQKDLRFKLLARVETTGALVQTLTVITGALIGMRYWALAAGQIVGAAVTTFLVNRHAGRPRHWPRLATLRGTLGFTNRVLIGRLAWYSYSNADFFVAGRVLGAGPLGLYSFGWNLTSLAVDKITTMVNGVTPAFFSALQGDPPGMRRMLLGITEALALAVLPVTVGVALVAPDLIPIVFGAKWTPAVGVVQLLVVYGTLRALRPVQNNVLVSVGDAGYLMWISIVSALVFPAAFFFGSRYGPTGIATVWAVLYPISMGVGYARLFRRGIVSPREYLHALWPALSATLAMSAVVLTLQRLVLANAPAVLRLVATVAAGAATYALVLGVWHRPRIQRFIDLVRRRFRRPAAAATA